VQEEARTRGKRVARSTKGRKSEEEGGLIMVVDI